MQDFFRLTRKTFSAEFRSDPQIPDNMWIKCPACGEIVYVRELEDNYKVCPKCGYHHRISSQEWLFLLDPASFEEHDSDLLSNDPLDFVSLDVSYGEKLKQTQEKLGMNEAVLSGVGTIDGLPLAIAICDFSFMGASMGSVYGEKMARAAERAAEHGMPLLTINRSGGARMQEGLISLMQMAKISVALTRLAAVRQPHISLLIDPCYGGVTASYASVADIIIAEPGASIGFAGKRVIEQTIREKLPPEFQTAEFMLEHGMVDMVTPRGELRGTLSRMLRLYAPSRVA